MRRSKYYTNEKPRENKMFFKTGIVLKIDLEMIALFLFVKSDHIENELDWFNWTPAQILKKLKQGILWFGTDFLDTNDSDNDNDYRWDMQPDFVHEWYLDQAALIFPEIDWNIQKENNRKD